MNSGDQVWDEAVRVAERIHNRNILAEDLDPIVAAIQADPAGAAIMLLKLFADNQILISLVEGTKTNA